MSNKTLVCIPSETRASDISWPSIKANVLDPLNADLAVCIGAPQDYDYANPLWQHAKYRFQSREFDDWGEALDLVQARLLGTHPPLPDWRSLTSIPGNWIGGLKGDSATPGSAAIQMYFRWLLLANLRDEGLLSKYDRFVYTRSDLVWHSPHPPIEALDKEFLWVPEGEHYGGVMDRHAVLSREIIEAYLNPLEPILVSPQTVRDSVRHKDEWNFESFFHLHLMRCGLKIKTFPYIMYAVRDAGTATRWSEGVWSDELGHYIKYPNEYLLVNRYKNYFANKQDWLNYFRPGQTDLALGKLLAVENGDVVYLNQGRLSVKAQDTVVPRRYVLKVDAKKEALSAFFVDPEVDFGTLFPHLSRLTIAKRAGPQNIEIKVSDNVFLSVDDNKNIVLSGRPALFRLTSSFET